MKLLTEEEYETLGKRDQLFTDGVDRIIKEIKDEITQMKAKTGKPQLGKKGCLKRLVELRDEVNYLCPGKSSKI